MAQIMSQDVHGQGWHGDIHLAAHMAFFGIVGIKTPMRLLMTRQIRAGGIILPTFCAGVLGFVLGGGH